MGTGRRKSGQSADTRDSGIGTGRTYITRLDMSWFPDSLRAKGDFSVDASTPRTRVNNWPRIRYLGQYSPIPEIQPSRSPSRSVQPDLRGVILSRVAPIAESLDILVQFQSDVQTLKMTSSIRPNSERVLHRYHTELFTNTAVPRFNGDACW